MKKRQSSRIISIILTVLMIFSICNWNVLAASDSTAVATLSDTSGVPGGTVTVTGYLAASSAIDSIQFQIDYDENVLTFESYTLDTLTALCDPSVDINTSRGLSNAFFVMYADGYDNTYTSGNIIQLTFKINDTASAGTTEVFFDTAECEVLDTNLQAMSLTASDTGVITILEPHSITYDSNGATSGSVPSDGNSYYEDDSVTILGNTGSLALEGKSFVGWSTSSTAITADYTAGSQMIMPNRDVTLYAVWSANAASTDTQFILNVSTPENTVDSTSTTAAPGDTVYLDFYLDNTFIEGELYGVTQVDLHLYYDTTKFSIGSTDYIINRDVVPSEIDMDTFNTSIPGELTVSFGDPAFTAYLTQTSGEKELVLRMIFKVLDTAAVGTSAEFTYDKQVWNTLLTLADSGNMIGGDGQVPMSYPAEYTTSTVYLVPSAISDLSATPGDGKVDLSWTVSTNATANTKYYVYRSTASDLSGATCLNEVTASTAVSYTDTSVTNNTTYYYAVKVSEDGTNFSAYSNIVSAKPVPPISSAFTYDGNGADGGAVPMDPTQYSAGASSTVLENTGSLTKTGYSFAGWSTSATATETEYIAGESITATSNPITLYAVWVPYTYTSSDGKVTITKYTGTETAVTVPETIAKLPVTVIGSNAFAGNTVMTTVAIPDSVTALNGASFRGCTALETVSFGAGSQLKYMWTNVFEGCGKLTTIELPATLTTISDYTFKNCTSLESLTMPDTVTLTGQQLFYGCTNLKTVHISTAAPVLKTSVFEGCTSLTTITVPESVTTVANRAFYGCTNLSEAKFAGNAPGTFGTEVFDAAASDFKVLYNYGTAGWTTPTWNGYTAYPSCTVSYDANGGTGDVPTDSGIYYNGDTVMVQFAELTKEGYSFAGWATSATAESAEYTQGGTTSFAMGTEPVTLYAVWEIDRAVTYNANGATSGSAPQDATLYSEGVTVTVLGNTGSMEKTGYTFTGWSTESDATEADYVAGESLTAADRVTLYAVWVPYTYTSNGTAITLTGYTGTETIVTVPETITKLPVTAIGSNVFAGKAVTAVTLPSSLTSMSNYAFQNCSALTSIAIPDGVTQLSNYLFAGCSELTTVSFGSGSQLEYIWTNTFKGCSKLTDIAIPATVTTISNSTFEGCSSLQSITIPDKVTLLGEKLFYGCTSLTTVHISAAATYLKPSMFEDCTSLTAITISEKVASIGNRAFYGCTNLSEAKFAGNAPTTFGTEVFDAAAAGFKVLYGYEKNGWSTPIWKGYAAYPYCTVTYDANGGSGEVPTDSATYSNGNTVTVQFAELTREGYSFAGWATSAAAESAEYTQDGTTSFAMGTEPVTLYAVWTGNALSYTGEALTAGTYRIAYTASVATAANGTGAYTYETASTLPEGLTLSSTGELAGTPTSAGSYEIVVTATDSGSGVTATATFTLTINAAGTVEAPTASLTPGSVEKGTEVTLSTATSDATIYYTTDGTEPTASSNVYSGAITINEAVTIKAIAVKAGYVDSTAASFAYTIATHTVSYDANGGSGEIPTDSGTYSNGNPVTVQFTPEPTRIGYNFAGWATSATAESAEYTQGGTASFAMGTADVTLYAVWSEIDRAVIYNANGATGGSAPQDVTPYSAGVTVTVLGNTGSMEKTGYTFTGWSTESDATEASYLAGESLTASDRVTLYAVWVPYTYTSSWTTITITGYTGTETIVTVPETIAKLPVTEIGASAFAGNTVMTTVAIPDSVTALNGASFRGCTALETVSFGAGSQLKYMWTNVFEGCGKLTTIELPATLTTISDYTFKNCTSLESVTMPDKVTLTGQQLFYGCTSLATVHISTAAPVLKTSVFEGCTSLTTITVPESVTTVANRAFYGCTNLSEVKFAGNAPATFGTEVFDAAASDFKVLYNYGTAGWSTPSWNGYTAYPSCTVSYDANGGTGDVPTDSGIYYNGDTVTVQFAELTKEGYSFAGWATSAAAESAEYTQDGTTSFAMGTEPITLYAVWISNALSYTGEALTAGTYGTPYTASVATAANGTGAYTYETASTLPEGLTLSNAGELAGTPISAGSYELVVTATDSGSGVTATATFTLTINTAGTVEAPTASLTPGSVEKGTEVTLSTATSDATIYYTTDGTDPTTSSNVYSGAITINEAVTIKAIAVKAGYVDSAAASFAYTIATHTVSYDGNGGTGDVPTDSGIYYNGDTVTVQFAPEPTRAGYVFAGWATSATAESAEYTQGGTASFAMGTADLTLYAVWSDIDRAVTYNANGATSGSAPQDATLYSEGVTVTVLGNTGSMEKTGYTFTGWSTESDATEADYLAGGSLTAADRVTLYAVWVPYTYTSSDGKVTITKYTGTETAVTVPETIAKLPVTVIGSNAFAGNTVMTTVAIPDSVTALNGASFRGCTALETVSFGAGSQLKYMWTNVFEGCGKLTTIELPATLTTISDYTFKNCMSLESLTMPDTVTLMGQQLFYGCTSLTTVHISAAATYLKPSMFEDCTSLTAITISEKVASIGNRAFYGCTNLSEAKFAGNAPTTFGTEVFDAAAAGFKVLYGYEKNGWSTPIWKGYAAYPYCTVTYDANGGSGEVPTDSATYSNGNTVTVQFAELTREGYSFAGWATSAAAESAEYTQDGTTSFAMGTEPVTLYAVWTGNALSYTGEALTAGTYRIAYTASVATAANGTGAYTYETASTLPEGLTLSSTGELAGTPTSAGSYEIVVTATDSGSGVTATATFTLTINAAGTVEAPTASLTPGSVEKGTEVTLSTATSDATIYYTTDGTEPTASSNVYSGAITINEAVTIKAIAVKAGYVDSTAASFAYTIATHTVSYDANGGSGEIPTDSGTYSNGNPVTVQFTPEPTRIGYNFAGWATSATAESAEYTQGGTASFAMGTADVTLYAVWSEIDRAVIYNANGATGGSAPQDVTPYSAGVTVTVLGNTGSMEKTGYTFTGWSTESDATEASYLAGESLTASDRVTLYAVWVPYTYTSSWTTITITGYTGTETIVTVPETIAKLPVTEIGASAFAEKSVTAVTLPSSLTSMSNYAFHNCTSLAAVNFGSNSQLTNIWTNVFNGCSSLTEIIIPDSVVGISNSAFEGCSSLQSITIPDKVTLLGEKLFYGCGNLATVHISTAAPVLKTSVFEGCTSLTTITVPESVTTVANRAFYGCTNLSEAKFAGNAPGTFGTEVFDAAASDFKVLYNYGTAGWSTPSWNGYTAYPSCTVSYDANGGTGDVPTDSGIYYNGDTVTVQFAELTKEGYSFAGWATSAAAESAEYTQDGTTSFAMGTEPVTLYAVWTSNELSYTGGTLAEGTYGTAYTASVATAANGTGAYTYTTTSTLPEGLTLSSAGELAGTPTETGSYEIVVTATDSNSGATATATFTLTINAAGTVEAPTASLTPGSVEKGTEVTLNTTTSDATIYYTTDGTDPTTSSNVYSGAITINEEVTIKAIAVKTGCVDSAAASFTYTIATHTVSYDGNGGTGDIPTDNGIYYNGDTVTVQFTPEPTRAGYVFAGWAASATAATADYTQGGTTSFAMGTENVTLYAVWSEIDRAVIYNANGATGGSAPEDTTPYSAGVTVTVLGNTGSLEKTGYTFTGWSTESDATEADYVVGESLTAADRVTLYAVWVPYTYTSNGTAITLTGYTGTETIVTVPETIAKLPVTAIGSNVFAGKAVTAVTLPSSLTSMSNYAFQNCSALTSIAIPDGVTQLSNYLFADCSELTTVSFGSSSQLEYIWTNAFKGCSKLTDIAIPATVTTISNSAFEGCSSLQSITIPDKVTLLGEKLFYGCTSLTTVHISAAATYLKPSMFEGCTSLTTITIPEKVTTIGNRAFYGCTNLSEAKFAGNAPGTFGTEVFDAAASDFKVLYNYGTAGWSTPSWNGYTAYPSCTVSYDTNGGTGDVPTDSGIYYNGDTVTVQFAELTKEGYSFAGWATTATATSAEYTQGGTTSFAMGTEPVTLYAVWTAISVNITFDANGGAFISGDTTMAVSVAIGSTAILPDTPSYTGYVFAGWYTDTTYSTEFDSSVVITGSSTVYAKWILRGDINQDGKLTASDYLLVKNAVLKKIVLNDLNALVGDMNLDSKITASDYLMLKSKVLNRI